MNKLDIHNKIFILICAMLIVLIIWKVPHEKDTPDKVKVKGDKSMNQ